MRAGRSAPGSSPRLVEHGHDVIASSRTAGKANRLASLGARPVTLDLLDPAAVREAVAAAAPEAIVHEATALAGTIDFKHFDESFATTNRLRTEGHRRPPLRGMESGRDPLRRAELRRLALRAGRRAREDGGGPARLGARRGDGRDARYDPARGASGGRARRHRAALRRLLRRSGATPRSSSCASGASRSSATAAASPRSSTWTTRPPPPSSRSSAASPASTTSSTTTPPPPASGCPPAEAVGAKPPRRVPRWLARLAAGEAGVVLMTESRGASNAKAKRVLGWRLRYPSWREGFRAAYAEEKGARAA